jgi:serine/threonine protein kinase
MFPYAQSNLRKYWDNRPKPAFNKTTLLWNLRQIKGIASALLYLHEFRVKVPLSVMNGDQIQNGGAKWSISDGEERFGRHGDIKPENMLWFQKIPGNADPLGVLQLADFGLGRFHGRDSRSRTNAGKIQYSPTYEPPECSLGKPVSRTYDFWSFGCVLLEYVTWLLKGSNAVYEFSDARAQGIVIIDDNFFTLDNGIKNGQKNPTAVVRQQVIDWVNDLHAHPNASRLIHDLLDLTMEGLLVVDAKNRARADTVDRELGKLLVKAAKDDRYLLDPLPFPQSKTQSTRDMQKRSQGIQIKF